MTTDSPITDSQRLSASLGGRTKGRSRDDWLTPPKLKRQIYRMWQLNYDPCPYPRAPWDGLKVDWGSPTQQSRAFVNPPYGRQVPFWLQKAMEEISNEKCQIAVFLLAVRTDCDWFHEYVLGGCQELWFVRGRVTFQLPGQLKSGRPAHASMLVVYYPDPQTNAIIGGSWSMDEGGPLPASKDHRARDIDDWPEARE